MENENYSSVIEALSACIRSSALLNCWKNLDWTRTLWSRVPVDPSTS